MLSSYQTEVPRARVNITLDVETNGACKKRELPLKMLVLGDFSNGAGKSPIMQKKRIAVNKANLDKVLTEISPRLKFNAKNRIVEDASELKINLLLDSFSKYRPEAIVNAVPELKLLLAMRNLLKDLKANLMDNAALRRELELVLSDRSSLCQLRDELRNNRENGGSFDAEQIT